MTTTEKPTARGRQFLDECRSVPFPHLKSFMSSVQTMPCAIMAFATFINPATFAPFT